MDPELVALARGDVTVRAEAGAVAVITTRRAVPDGLAVSGAVAYLTASV